MYFSYDFRPLSERWFDEALPVNYYTGLSIAIGSGDNGTITIVDLTKTSLSIKAVLGQGNNVALSAAYADGLVTITLGTNESGVADATKNTATLIAAAINAIEGKTWTATASGTGATAISAAIAETAFVGFEVDGTPCPIAGLGLYDVDNNVYYVCTEADNTDRNTHWIKLTPSSL